jgi:hypothetical protein
VLSAAIREDPVVFAALQHDGDLVALAYLDRADGPPPANLVEKFGEPRFTAIPLIPAPKSPEEFPSSMELKVMRQLIADARAPPAEVARRTGLTARTVRRVRAGLVDQGLVQVQTLLHAARAPGRMIYYVGLYHDGADGARILEQAYPGSFVLGSITRPDGRALICQADTLSQVVDQRERALRLPGVTDVRVALYLDIAFQVTRLTGWIDRELERWKRIRLSNGAAPARAVTSSSATGAGSPPVDGALRRRSDPAPQVLSR